MPMPHDNSTLPILSLTKRVRELTGQVVGNLALRLPLPTAFENWLIGIAFKCFGNSK